MDYKKNYKEALERARALRNEAIEKGYVVDYIKDYETIFPELRESEDERIRRTLVEYFGPGVQLDLVRGVPIQKIRDWLEKQKENPKSADSIPSKCASDAKCEDRSQKHNISVDEIAQDYVDGIKEYNPDPTWDLMQTAVCYGYHYREQKEKKD